jgi:uncharacterized membrane protein YhaH (DUF805 family)
MNLVPMVFSYSGRLAPRPFAVGVIAVYLLGFASQVLLAEPTLARAGVWPFALAQAVLLWVWFTLHAKRLRDADRGSGVALGIAIVNVLSILLLLIVVAVFLTPVPAEDTTGSVLGTWVAIVFLFAILTGAPALGFLGFILLAAAFVVLIPILLAIGFSIWTGTQPRASRHPP